MTELVPQKFTDAEKARMKDDLVIRLGEVYALRAQKKQQTAVINADIGTAEKVVADLQEKLQAGFEMVEVEVDVKINQPEPGMKLVVRMDTCQTLRTERMTPRECQQHLDFDSLDPDK